MSTRTLAWGASAAAMTPSPVGGSATPTLPTTAERSGSVAIQAAFSPYTQPCAAPGPAL